LSFASVSSSGGSSGRAAFSRQFDSQADRASSDYDQRHNFVAFAYWDAPGIFANTPAAVVFRGWTFAGLVAVRSGFPYTVIGTSRQLTGQGYILNNRPNLLDPNNAFLDRNVTGGKMLLNAADFVNADPSTLGNVGRNSFTGPGFYNLDVALTRSFALPWLGESGRLRLRADSFNVLNHANLNPPNSNLGDPANFGIATFGRQENQKSGFPAVSPLSEGPRTFQLSVKVEF
jgi:hypothetical protein